MVTTTQRSPKAKRVRSSTLSQPSKSKTGSLPKSVRLTESEYQDLMSEMREAAQLMRQVFKSRIAPQLGSSSF